MDNVEVCQHPAYKVVFVSRQLERSSDAPNHAEALCSSLMAWVEGLGRGNVSSFGLSRFAKEGPRGIAVLHAADWTMVKEANVVFNVRFDDGFIVDTNDSKAFQELGRSIEENPSVSFQETPPGLYAVCRHKGPYTDLNSVYQWLIHTWLPENGFRHAGGPMIELYINDDGTIPSSEIITDVCCPVTPN